MSSGSSPCVVSAVRKLQQQKKRCFQKETDEVERYPEWARNCLLILVFSPVVLKAPPRVVGVRVRVSQRAPDSDSKEAGLDIDLLIDLIREWEPLWNMGDRRHADLGVTRQLWKYANNLWTTGRTLMFGPRIKRRESCQAVAVTQGSLQEGVQQGDAGPEWIGRTQEQVQTCLSPVVPQVDDAPSAALGSLQS
ncbi:uncharacterized protein LOC143796873 [Ranitomeya variabilis]|uniref:uncharacterized protein LOC143796873 n=1 Tax=Ranitomeya variabilis TaxID=490064 RepID=UPI004055DC53